MTLPLAKFGLASHRGCPRLRTATRRRCRNRFIISCIVILWYGGNAHDITHTHDAVGSRLTKLTEGVNTRYSYDAANQLTV